MVGEPEVLGRRSPRKAGPSPSHQTDPQFSVGDIVRLFSESRMRTIRQSGSMSGVKTDARSS